MKFSFKTAPHLLACLAFLVLLVASTYHLSESPGIWYDEGYITQTAMNLAREGKQVIQVAPGVFDSAGSVTTGFPLVYPVSLSYDLFGVGVTQGRVVMVLFLIGFVTASYFLIRELFGRTTALWSLFLTVSFPMLYGNGKSVLGEVPGLFYLVTCLLSLVHLERSGFKRIWLYAVTGFFGGMCVATKPIFLIFGLAALIAWTIRFKAIPIRLGGFGIALIAFIIPVGIWFITQFGTQDSFSNILGFYANPYHTHHYLSDFLHNAFLFISTVGPFYTLVSVGIWTVFVFIRIYSKDRIGVAEWATFLFCLLIMAAFLRLPGWSRYLFPATTLGLLFLPSSMFGVYNSLARYVGIVKRVPILPQIVLSAMILLQFAQLVHGSYVAQYYKATRTRDVSAALSTISSNQLVFVYNAPETVIFLPSENYYQYLHPHEEGGEIAGETYLPLLSQGVPDVVIVAKADYEAHPDLFAKYNGHTQVNRYILLKKI